MYNVPQPQTGVWTWTLVSGDTVLHSERVSLTQRKSLWTQSRQWSCRSPQRNYEFSDTQMSFLWRRRTCFPKGASEWTPTIHFLPSVKKSTATFLNSFVSCFFPQLWNKFVKYCEQHGTESDLQNEITQSAVLETVCLCLLGIKNQLFDKYSFHYFKFSVFSASLFLMIGINRQPCHETKHWR